MLGIGLQLPLEKNFTGGGGPSFYQGPGDVVSGATAWYGLRAYSSAQTSGTTKAINVRRASDSATADIVILTNGNLDVATLTSFLTATTGFITKWYDQSGNGIDASQITPANQPQIALNTLNSNPAIKFVRASSLGLFATLGAIINQPLTAIAVAERTGTLTSQQEIISTYQGGTSPQLGFGSGGTTNTVFAWSGAAFLNATAADNAPHSLIFMVNNASSAIYVEGVSTSGTATGTGATTTALGIGANNFGTGNFLDGFIFETGLYPIGFTPTQAGNMNANQRAYWGF